MKTRYLIYILLFTIVTWTYSCKKENTDITAPGELTNISITPLNGGAQIDYTLPTDSDILYVKASYTNSLGENVFKSASRYTNSIQIDGFNDTLQHHVKLTVIDKAGNQSKGIEKVFNPLISYIYLVNKSIDLSPTLGGVTIKWENISAKPVFVYVYYTYNSKEESRILSSDRVNEQLTIRGLDSVKYDFSVKVEDFKGNQTQKEYKASLKPLFEEKIDKSTWTLESSLSVNGNAWEGLTVNFWDDVIDTKDSPSDNSYFIINRDNNGGSLNYPMDIVINMNKKIVLNRFKVWQRAYEYIAGNNGVSQNYYYYKSENLRSFNLYASNDKSQWLLIGSFDIGDPKDENGNVPSDKITEAINGHEFELPQATEPFQYLKFSITSNYGSETNIYGSEITLYGLDNVSNK